MAQEDRVTVSIQLGDMEEEEITFYHFVAPGIRTLSLCGGRVEITASAANSSAHSTLVLHIISWCMGRYVE